MAAKLTSASAPPFSDLRGISLATTEHAPLPMVTVEGATRIVRYGNPAFCRLMDRPLEQLVGKPFDELMPDKDRCVTLLERVFRTRKPESFTEKDPFKPHPVFWSYTIWPVQADAGLVGMMIQVTETAKAHETAVAMNEALIIGSVRQHELIETAENLNLQLQEEIAARKKTAQELSEKARLIDLSNDAIIVRDLDDKIRLWNKGAEKLFGWTFEEVTGKDLHTLLQTEFSLPKEEIIAHLHREGRFNGEVVQITRDGRRVRSLCGWVLDRSTDSIFTSYTDITERTKAVEALRESEERYRTLFNSMDEGFCIIEMIFDARQNPVDWRYLEVNPSFEKQSGMSGATGKRMSELAPHLEAHWYEAYGKVALTGEPVRFINEAKNLGRWFDLYAFRVGGPDSRKVAVIFTDITERRNVDEALRRSEARFAAIIAQATAGIAEIDLTGKFTSVNERFCAIVGRTPAQLLELRVHDITHADDLLASAARFKSVAMGGADFSLEKRYLRPDGTHVWVSNSVAWIIDRDDVPHGFVEIAQDISERKRLEAALQASETYFRELTQSLPIGVWTSQPDGPADFINRHWLDYTGQTFRHAMAHPEVWANALHPDDRARVEQVSGAAHAIDQGYTVEARFREASTGEYRWFLKRSMPVRDAGGSLQKRIGICIDIEDLKRAQTILADHAGELELQVQARTEELRETIGELEAFSYSVSHDMRAPLRAMQGFALLLLKNNEASLDAASADQLRRIRISAARMDALINDVLTYSRLLRSEIVLQPVGLDDLVRLVIATYPNLQANGAEIAIEGTLPTVLANEAGLTQCISNLLTNAVKFVAPRTAARVRIHADEIEGDVRLWIEDNGIGINARDHQRIWNIFTQVGRAKDYEGTGIGLAIARKAVERMNGQIGLESELGRGSRFWLRLRKG